jgi:SRSO17 transposase
VKYYDPERGVKSLMVPIVSIPARIEAGLAPYRDLFPRSETYQHIKEYCTGLVVLEKPSIDRLAACLIDGPAQSSINKALTRSPWSGEAVNQRRLERIQKHHRGKGLRRGIIDSTFSHPPGGRRRSTESIGTGITVRHEGAKEGLGN